MDSKKSENYKRCIRCILPDHLPSVHLDKDGICNHCRKLDSLMGDWERNKSQRLEELESLINRTKKTDQQYDCLVTLSGGKDSTFALYLMAKVYKLKCLCVTFDNGFMSEFARRNITKAIESANADHIYYHINQKNLLRLYNLSLKKSGQFCSVCMRGISMCMEFPLKAFNIPLAISGDGKRISYLNSFPEVFQGGDARYFTNMVSGDPLEKESKPMLISGDSLHQRVIGKLRYISRSIFKLQPDKNITYLQLYDFVEFSPNKILKIIQDEMGWTKPEVEYEHIDCLLHEMQHYVNIYKFEGITMHTFYRSYLIRLGILTRDEALSLEYEELNIQKEPEILDSFLKQIQMSPEEFFSSVSNWKNIDKFRTKKNRITSI
jgi:N-acetyl sugar amidotransferase